MIVPITVVAYSLIISPFLLYAFPSNSITAPRVENQIFWPLATLMAFACFAFKNRSPLTWPPHIIWYGAYALLAGASISWAFKPEISLTRFVTEMMLNTCIILPAMLAVRTADLMRGVFLVFAFGVILNATLILGGYSEQSLADDLKIGYPGYFPFKGTLGQFAAFAILFSLYEIISIGGLRWLGFVCSITSIYLIVVSGSKGSLAFVLIAAFLAKILLFIQKTMRISPALALVPVLIFYAILSRVVDNLINRISWYVYHNYNFSGRTDIWDFVNFEIAKRPFWGWGYRSFWLVGPDGPSQTDAWGWIRNMPNAHSGYLDTILDTGYIGLVLFLIFIFRTLQTIGSLQDRDPVRAWLLLSIALFVVLINFIESGWMRGGDPLWLMFVLVVAEVGRYRGGRPEAGLSAASSTTSPPNVRREQTRGAGVLSQMG